MEEPLPSPSTPEENDLVKLCSALNEQGARYIIVGGMAVNQQGFLRATEDIDLLLEDSLENQRRVLRALEVLPDKAVLEVGKNDLNDYTVVRVADEIVVDLMLSACGITYQEAVSEIEIKEIKGISVPFASAKLLLRMKQTYRDRALPDRVFLEEKLRTRSQE
jgi:hypothetical protein